VSALHEPPSVGELAGSTAHGPAAVDGLLAAADRAYARWTLGSVREAQSMWLEAAAADPSSIAAWIGASRAGVWLSGHEPEPTAREAAAVSAVQSAQLCGEASPGEGACDYWLAVALGVQARERRATALDALPRMVALLEQVAVEQPKLEHAGPHRVLALVLVRAPGWPAGPGDADGGLEHARRAAALAPEFPPNQLCLAEALAAVDEREESRKALNRALKLVREWQDRGEPEADEWLAEIDAATTGGWAK
jgi:tetratricopeptide (TPR) repeat protein